jgi:SAM-dependent methyltransferase
MAAPSIDQLRHFAVSRQFVPRPLEGALDHLGFVQADPIRAPARAQDLTLRQRVAGYRAGELERRYAALPVEEDFFINYGFVTRRISALMHPRDGARLPFDDEAFDIVLAPYVMSVVPDPLGVGREIRRVCRPDGRVIILNHFLGRSAWRQWLEGRLSPLTERIGFRTDLPLAWLLAGSGLEPVASQAVNVPPIWTLVTCVRAPVPGTGAADRLPPRARP